MFFGMLIGNGTTICYDGVVTLFSWSFYSGDTLFSRTFCSESTLFRRSFLKKITSFLAKKFGFCQK